MIQAFGNACHYYYDNLPSDTFQTVCKSAIYSYTFSVLWANDMRKWEAGINLALPLASAGVAALASLIHALTTPLFNAVFGDKEVYFHREWIKQFTNMTIKAGVIAYFTSTKVNFVVHNLGPPSFHLATSLLKCLPDMYDWIGLDDLANQFRTLFRTLHLYPEAGSNAIYLDIYRFSE